MGGGGREGQTRGKKLKSGKDAARCLLLAGPPGHPLLDSVGWDGAGPPGEFSA